MWPDAEALVFPHQQVRLSFKTYHDNALALAGALAARGVKADDHIALLAENRAGLELIRMALAELGSPYTQALDVIRTVLPDPAPRDLDKALELARTGPPEEEVGLEPFAPPDYMGALRR